jgi:hypothetical protein
MSCNTAPQLSTLPGAPYSAFKQTINEREGGMWETFRCLGMYPDEGGKRCV